MADSLEPSSVQPIPRPKDDGGKELYRILNNDYMIHNLKKRVRDLQKNLKGCLKELQNLSQMTEVINTKQLEDVYKGVEKNTKALVDAAAANERAAASLEIMQIVFFASETFGYIDHFMGFVGCCTSDWQQWVLDHIIGPPGRWFAFSMSICLFCCFLLKKLMGHLAEGSLNFLSFEVVFNTRIDASALKDYLDTKDLAVSDGQLGLGGSLTKSAVWDEDDEAVWEGAPPPLEISWDAVNGFLLNVGFTIDKKNSSKTELELQVIFMKELTAAGVVKESVVEDFERETREGGTVTWEAKD